MAYFYDSIRYEANLETIQKIYPKIREMWSHWVDTKREGNPGGSRVISTQSNPASIASEDYRQSEVRQRIKELFIPSYQALHAADYDVAADRERAKRLIKRFRQEASSLPTFYQLIDKEYKGNVDAYVNDLFDKSFYGNEKRMKRFLRMPSRKKMTHDPAVLYTISKCQYVTLIRRAGYGYLLVNVPDGLQ